MYTPLHYYCSSAPALDSSGSRVPGTQIGVILHEKKTHRHMIYLEISTSGAGRDLVVMVKWGSNLQPPGHKTTFMTAIVASWGEPRVSS